MRTKYPLLSLTLVASGLLTGCSSGQAQPLTVTLSSWSQEWAANLVYSSGPIMTVPSKDRPGTTDVLMTASAHEKSTKGTPPELEVDGLWRDPAVCRVLTPAGGDRVTVHGQAYCELEVYTVYAPGEITDPGFDGHPDATALAASVPASHVKAAGDALQHPDAYEVRASPLTDGDFAPSTCTVNTGVTVVVSGENAPLTCTKKG